MSQMSSRGERKRGKMESDEETGCCNATLQHVARASPLFVSFLSATNTPPVLSRSESQRPNKRTPEADYYLFRSLSPAAVLVEKMCCDG